MKNNLLKIVFGVAVIATSLSSCTKEQTSLNLLKGTWTLDRSFDTDGDPVDPTDNFGVESQSTEVTFFECNGKDNEPCTGVSKTTTFYEDDNDAYISTGAFNYEVHDKTILVWNGDYYEIDELSKKSLVIYPAAYPLAKQEFSK